MSEPGTGQSFVIRGARLLDQTGERSGEVRVDAAGMIDAVGPDLRADRVLDASGCILSRGLVDVHAHLREPGDEEAETIESATRSAALGGYTAIVAMPDTDPVIDTPGAVREIRAIAANALCHVEVAASITVGLSGEQLVPIGELAAIGVRLFADVGRGVQNDRLMRRALEYASAFDVVLAQHCGADELGRDGHMHEGAWSSRLGIAGVPAEAEELMVLRDIALSRLTGARVHFQNLSTAGSIAMVRAARGQGVPVTAAVSPHHFTLTDEACRNFDPNMKLDPPLRTNDDRLSLIDGLGDGSIDIIASGHAPHAPHTKDVPFDQAPFGAIGLEHTMALSFTELDLEPSTVLSALSWKPATLAGLGETHGSPIVEGTPANLLVFDPNAKWTIEANQTASRSRNTPHDQRVVEGRVRHTITNGEIVVEDGVAQR